MGNLKGEDTKKTAVSHPAASNGTGTDNNRTGPRAIELTATTVKGVRKSSHATLASRPVTQKSDADDTELQFPLEMDHTDEQINEINAQRKQLSLLLEVLRKLNPSAAANHTNKTGYASFLLSSPEILLERNEQYRSGNDRKGHAATNSYDHHIALIKAKISSIQAEKRKANTSPDCVKYPPNTKSFLKIFNNTEQDELNKSSDSVENRI